MTKFEMIDVHPRNKGNGPVRWTERLILNISDKGAAFFGRMIGVYDHVNGFVTDIDALDNIHARSNKFRELNIWFDNAPRKVRNAHSRICGDFPGIGKDAVLDPSVSIDEIRRWRDYESGRLMHSDMLDAILKRSWDGDFVQMGLDLHIPIKGMNLIRNWWEVPSYEGCMIIGHAAAATDKEDVIETWKRTEDMILALPGTKRKEEYLGY